MKEIDNIKEFKHWLDMPNPAPAAIKDLDIRPYEDRVVEMDFKDSFFLGCEMSRVTAGHIVFTGGVVIPDSKKVRFPVHRARLYSPEELFAGFDEKCPDGYFQTFDYQVYKEYVQHGMDQPKSIFVSLMRRLHDHSISDALEEAIEGRKVVAVMGGHSIERSEETYLKIALIAGRLSRKGYLMVSGGGPGAMEATNLGAYFSARSEAELKEAIAILKKRPKGALPHKEYKDPDWLHRAWKVREAYPVPAGKEKASMSIGIPTWLYGHEPPNPFASHIAKYFANSVREDGLLSIAHYGVIFAPGSAGTTQEVFQDATKNHYAQYNDKKIPKYISPMIFMGVKHWTQDRPVYPLLQKLAKNQKYHELLFLSDDIDEIIEKILEYRREDYMFGDFSRRQ